MDAEIFRNISRIIERDSKVSTYKFALLRGTIDVIQENSPYIKQVGDRIHMPTGLLIEKWLIYYYPLLEAKVTIPQNYGAANLAFEEPFRELIAHYREHNSLSVFYRDLKQGEIPEEVAPVLRKLVKSLRDTITRMPMRYIGNSVYGEDYSVYRKEGGTKRMSDRPLDRGAVIETCGWFSIPIEYYEAFRMIGSFVGGQDSILFKWAEFSVRAEGNDLSMEAVLDRILQSPVTERDSEQSKKLYREILQRSGKVQCVWTGKNLTDYHVDHVIPFAVWRNNDLWNLLPASSRINGQKSDKIPTPEVLHRSADRIMSYWERIEQAQPARFQREIDISLLGATQREDWRSVALHQLQERCNYLIESRGFDPWNG